MAQVNVEIAGRTYRMACNDGEEEHLRTLAARFDGKIHMLRGTFGEIGDSRITVMAALTIADQLREAERRVGELEHHAADPLGIARRRRRALCRGRRPDDSVGRSRGSFPR